MSSPTTVPPVAALAPAPAVVEPPSLPASAFVRHRSRSRFAVIVPAGDASCHESSNWASNDRDYDLIVNYFGEKEATADRLRASSDAFFQFQGPKWRILARLLSEYDVTGYEYVWFPDDDLLISTPDINLMFLIAEKHRLKLGQPSQTNQFVAHDHLVQDPDCELRFVNFVELMCPFFHKSALHILVDCIRDPKVKCGWGMDYVWASELKYSSIGIVDLVSVVHTREQAGLSTIATSSFYQKYEIYPVYEMNQTLGRFGLGKRGEHKILSRVLRSRRALPAAAAPPVVEVAGGEGKKRKEVDEGKEGVGEGEEAGSDAEEGELEEGEEEEAPPLKRRAVP